jgi:hypothetical protein
LGARRGYGGAVGVHQDRAQEDGRLGGRERAWRSRQARTRALARRETRQNDMRVDSAVDGRPAQLAVSGASARCARAHGIVEYREQRATSSSGHRRISVRCPAPTGGCQAEPSARPGAGQLLSARSPARPLGRTSSSIDPPSARGRELRPRRGPAASPSPAPPRATPPAASQRLR